MSILAPTFGQDSEVSVRPNSGRRTLLTVVLQRFIVLTWTAFVKGAVAGVVGDGRRRRARPVFPGTQPKCGSVGVPLLDVLRRE